VNALTVGAKLNPGMPFPAVKMAILRDVRTAQNMFKDAKTKWEQDHFGENDPSGIYARLYLQGLYDFVAGYHAWAETCPRYIVNTQG
jgi:hypothetical protein